jgi:hypothetical protein
METTWFAIDRDGHVAAFDSREAGGVPTAANLGEDYLAVEVVVMDVGMREPAELPDDLDPEDRPGQLAWAGVYAYAHDFEIAGPYHRTGAPTRALTADRLPAATVARMARFDGRFADQERLQPFEHWPSEAGSALWLASDEITVRCVPGREADFAKEAQALAESLDDPGVIVEPPPPAPT